jgi:hypothetical protein
MKTKCNPVQFRLLAVLLLALPVVVQAQFIYTTNNSVLTLIQYTGPGGDVTIPDKAGGLPVGVVAPAAFFQISALTSVTFGTNVATIANNAIFQCPNLAGVFIPASVTNIGTGPMIDCKSLTTISVSPANSSYTNVNQVLFNKPLTSLIEFSGGVGGSYTIPASVTNVGQAFIGNSLAAISVNPANTYFTNLAGVLFDKSKTFLYSYPGGAPGSYAVPTNATTIVSGAFEYSAGVTTVSIGTNVSSIGTFAFYDCPNLIAISVNATNAFYSSTNGILFDKNKTTLIQYPIANPGSYLVPGTVVNIGDGAFGDAFGLTSVVIPNGVTTIAQQAFYGCLNLSGVFLGNSVKTIGPNAFFSCSSLSDVVFPASLSSLGQYSFGGCQNLSSVCFSGNQPADGGNVFYSDPALSTILYVSGKTGWGATYDGIPTTPCTTCGGGTPQLGILLFGTNVIVAWLTSFTGFNLESTTNLVLPVVWITNSTAPVIINQYYAVTNPIAGTRMFYRLIQ